MDFPREYIQVAGMKTDSTSPTRSNIVMSERHFNKLVEIYKIRDVDKFKQYHRIVVFPDAPELTMGTSNEY